MYVRNKCLWMRKQGWSVELFSASSGKVYISELKEFNTFIPELNFNYYLFPKYKRERIIQKMLSRIVDSSYDEIIIESTSIPESTWAEVLAAHCKGQHLSYLLQEENRIETVCEQDFFKFKYSRKELVSITPKSLYDMFLPFFPISMAESEMYYLPAYCNNVTEDVDSDLIESINASKCDYIVGCLSRLDKPFIIPTLQHFKDYVAMHHDKRFLLVMMGGASSNYEVQIRKIFNRNNNVKLIITGYLFPISTRLLKCFQAFFSSAGSAWVCMRSGIPTISIDGTDFEPIGILGRTTMHCLFRDNNEPPLSFSNLLDDILINKIYENQPATHQNNHPDFCKHDLFLKTMKQDYCYFSFEQVPLSFSDYKLKFLLFVMGARNYFLLSDYKNRIKTKYNLSL